MAGNLKSIAELQAEVETAGFRGIDSQVLLDTLQSLSKVAGTMVLNDPLVSAPLVGSWNRFDAWELSFDSQGVVSGLSDPTDPGGYYSINAQAGGDYTCQASLRFSSDLDGVYEIRIAKRDAGGVASDIQYQDAIAAVAGETVQLNIASGLIKDVVNGDRLQLEIRGAVGAVITSYYGQFGVQR